MDYFKSFSAKTQAAFYKAEAEMIRFAEKAEALPYAGHLRNTLLAIDAVFAVRMAHDVSLPAVPLIVAHDVAGWKYDGDMRRCIGAIGEMFHLPEGLDEVAVEAERYIHALQWTSQVAAPGFVSTPATLVQLNKMLVGDAGTGKGKGKDAAADEFRSAYLPGRKGFEPDGISDAVKQLCTFCNGDYFSPLGQASVIHHAVERIAPFDDMVDRTGLLFAFIPMFRRGLFSNKLVVPICWGASLERDYRNTLKEASREEEDSDDYALCRERWAAYNARNTSMAVMVADMFLQRVEKMRASWRQRGLKISANSATEKLLDLFLAIPQLSIRHAADRIGKSYGATNEAMHQLVKAEVIEEVPIDNRERIFICTQSAELIAGFVEGLEHIGERVQ